MKPLKPAGQVDLEHRAYHLQGSGKTIVAASSDGHVSLVNLTSKKVLPSQPAKKLAAAALHPTRKVLAIIEGTSQSLSVLGTDGTKIAQIKSRFDTCSFDEGGEFLWLVARSSADECQIVLVETKNWSIVCSEALNDTFGESLFSFHCTATPGLLSLWMGGGQDGQEVFWLRQKGAAFTLERAKALANCTFPVFSSDGSHFLVFNDDRALCRYSAASMKRVGKVLELDDEEDSFAESLAYIDRRYALAATVEQRIFLIDADKMKIEDEIGLEGHEPRPLNEYFPTVKATSLGTDISWFTRIGDAIVFVFRRRGSGGKNWKDSLLWYSIKE